MNSPLLLSLQRTCLLHFSPGRAAVPDGIGMTPRLHLNSLQVFAWYWPPILFVALLSTLVCLYHAYLVVRSLSTHSPAMECQAAFSLGVGLPSRQLGRSFSLGTSACTCCHALNPFLKKLCREAALLCKQAVPRQDILCFIVK